MYTTGVAIVTSRLYYATFILIKRFWRRLFNRSSGFNAFGDHFKFFIKTPKHLLLKMRYTANVCRDLRGVYREIRVRGFQIYGDCM